MKLLNEADIKNFYNWLNHKKHGYTEVNIIKPKIIYPNGEKIEGKMFATGFFNNAEDVLSICQRYSGFQDPADNRFVMLYIGVNPRKKELFDLSPNKLDFKQKPSASDNHIAAYINGYIDCDHADDSKQAVTLEEVRLTEKAANHISDWFKAKGFIQPAPGMSGNGWQLHYAVPAIGPEDNLSELKGKLKTFSRQIQEECKMNGVRIDSTFEPRRIAKLFGTLSTKGEPELHRLTTWSSNVRYEDEKLRDYIISLSPYDDSRNLSISIQIDSKQALDPYFLKLIKHDQAINKLWNKGINNDRSKTDYSLVSQLVEYGITEEIKLCKILYDAPHGKASSYPDPPKYIAGLLSKFAPPKIHMMDINNALYATKRVSAEVMIASIGETYTVPKEVKYKCTKNTLCKNAGNCLLSRGPVTKILRANDRRLIDLTKIRDSKRDRIILGILNLSCNEIHLAYEIKEYVSIQEMVVIPKARITKMVKKDSSNIMLDEIGREFREKVVYFMGTSPQSNKYFTATGWVMPSPN